MKIKLIAVFYLLISAYSVAQIKIGSAISSDSIMVGDQFLYKIGVSGPGSDLIKWPKIKEKIGDFEIIEELGYDTVSHDPLTIDLGFVLTHFDTGVVEIPSQLLTLNEDSIHTKLLHVTVLPVHIDSNNAQLFGYVPPIEIPYEVGEFRNLIIGGIIGLILIIGLIVLMKFLAKRKGEKPVVKETIPAHILALGELGDLESLELLKEDRVKDYYSNLSDILRRYLENRYDFLALESTTDEILKEVKSVIYKSEHHKDIQTFLTDADLVKFAKAHPEEYQHEQYFKFVKAFVLDTKVVVEKEIKEDGDE